VQDRYKDLKFVNTIFAAGARVLQSRVDGNHS